jgi:hypothetical protein
MMGQFDDLIPRGSPGGVVIGSHPRDPSKALQDTRTRQEIDLANATAAARAQEARAQAQHATIDAKTAQEQYDAQHRPASTSGVYGPDYLKTLSPSDQNMVKALSEGRMAFPQGSALRAPFWQEKLSQVAQFDPTFDATDFNARAKARANAISGKLGASNNALNTAIGHAGQLMDQIGGTASHGPWHIGPVPIPLAHAVNSIQNATSEAAGEPGVPLFRDTAQKLADELEAVYRNGGGAEQGVVRQLRSFDPNASEDQKRAVIGNAMELLASKMAANVSQYNFGTGGKPTWDMLDPHTLTVLQQHAPDLVGKYFTPPSAGGGGVTPGGGGPPSPLAPRSGGREEGLQGIINGLGTPGNQQSVAQGATRNVWDPQQSGELSGRIHEAAQRRDLDPKTAAAAIASWARTSYPQATPLSEGDIAQWVTYLRAHPGYKGSVAAATRTVPLSFKERVAGSPATAMAIGGINAATAGYSDEIAAGVGSLFGADYTQTRDKLDAAKKALAATHPEADMAGNVVGGAASMLGGEALLGRLAPKTVGLGARLFGPRAAPLVADAGYGALYGSGENNDNRGLGAVLGGAAGVGGGMAARGATRGLASIIAPTGGKLGPLYEQGVFPTLGQRGSAATGLAWLPGRIASNTEQALQSIPIAGGLPARARNIARDQYQIGAFNQALGELRDPATGQPMRLPDGMRPGTEPHAFTHDAFTNAYDAARSGMSFVHDPQFDAARTAWRQTLDNGILNAEQVQQVKQVVNSAVGSRMTTTGSLALPGDAYKAAASELSTASRAWSKTDPDKAAALNDYISIFDDAARRNSHPDAVEALDNADRGWAKFVRIQNASEMRGGGAAGTFNPNQLDRSVQRNSGGMRSSAYNQGDALMQDYSDAGKFLADTLPNSGTADRLMMGQAAGGAGGLGAGIMGLPLVALAKPGALALSPYVPGMNKLVTRAMAPRSATLPPALAAPLDALGSQINNRASMIGRLALPASLAWELGQ